MKKLLTALSLTFALTSFTLSVLAVCGTGYMPIEGEDAVFIGDYLCNDPAHSQKRLTRSVIGSAIALRSRILTTLNLDAGLGM
jgi:hypothetical protein